MDYEPITKGLREYIERHPTMMHAVGLVDLLDNIDAIHCSLEAENKEMFDFCDRLKAASEYREDVTLYDVDYIPVPLDKDGVPIHIGDVMSNTHKDGFIAKTVVGISFHSGGRITVRVADGRMRWHNADELHHYRPDTFERIIADAIQAGRADAPVDVTPLIKRCKALAGEGE